jgi:hypothetical protein
LDKYRRIIRNLEILKFNDDRKKNFPKRRLNRENIKTSIEKVFLIKHVINEEKKYDQIGKDERKNIPQLDQ